MTMDIQEEKDLTDLFPLVLPSTTNYLFVLLQTHLTKSMLKRYSLQDQPVLSVIKCQIVWTVNLQQSQTHCCFVILPPRVLLILFSLFISYNSGYMPVLKPIISTHLFFSLYFLFIFVWQIYFLICPCWKDTFTLGITWWEHGKEEKAWMHSCFCLIFFHKLPIFLTILKSNLSSVVNIWKLKYFLSPANYWVKLTYVLWSSFRPSK